MLEDGNESNMAETREEARVREVAMKQCAAKRYDTKVRPRKM